MPIGTTFTISQIFILFPAVVVAMLKGPETPDVYAVLGAVFATVIVTLDSKSKTRNQVISSIMGCGGMGSVLPGLIVNQGFPTYYDTLTWHAWAFLGFLFGGIGYSLIKMIWYVAVKRAGELVEEQIERFTGKTKPVAVIKKEDEPHD
jgi:hypothetical protein